MAYQTSPESEEYHSLSGNEPEDDEDDAESETMEPPVHPVPAMQAAFEESIVESTADEDLPRLSLERDPEARRQKLLNSKQYDHSLNSRWNQRTTAQHHPLVKLIAQIIFGMHLLQQEQAKSEEEVVKILQTHVNEVDSFLERTSEDFELAIKDIEERIRFLKLPMKHLDVFEIMLDEKKFRTQLLEGNEKIEKIIERTAEAMDAALLDVQTGAMANKELSRYLDRVHDKWPREKRAISDVFGAMRGNEQGWTGYLKDLQVKGKALESNLERLGKVITQMSKLAAAASRRNKAQGDRASAAASASKSAPNSPGLRSKFAPDPAPPPLPGSPPSRSASLNKPLPREPKVVGGAPQVGKGNGVHPVPLSQRFESPRQTPQSPPEPRRGPTAANGEIQRPKTADGPVRRKEARAADERANTTELLQFFKAEHSNPLRSNPPSTYKGVDGSARERKPIRSQSQGANVMLDSRVPEKKTHPVGRSMSQSAIEMQSKPKSIPIALPAISENEKPSVYQPSESQSPPRRSAFARRLSRRMRHLETPDYHPQQQSQYQPQQQSHYQPQRQPHLHTKQPSLADRPSPSSEKTTSPPIDSAYASSIEKPYQRSPAQQYPHPPPSSPFPEQAKQPMKGFTLFPKTSEPSMASSQGAQGGGGGNDAWAAEEHQSTATSMQSKGVSFGSMRRYFHLRKGSRKWS